MSESRVRELIEKVNAGDRAAGYELLRLLSCGDWQPSSADGLNAPPKPVRVVGIHNTSPADDGRLIAALVEQDSTIWRCPPMDLAFLQTAVDVCGLVGIEVLLVLFENEVCPDTRASQTVQHWLVSVSATPDIVWPSTDWTERADLIVVPGGESQAGELLVVFLREQLPRKRILPVITDQSESIARVWLELTGDGPHLG